MQHERHLAGQGLPSANRKTPSTHPHLVRANAEHIYPPLHWTQSHVSLPVALNASMQTPLRLSTPPVLVCTTVKTVRPTGDMLISLWLASPKPGRTLPALVLLGDSLKAILHYMSVQ